MRVCIIPARGGSKRIPGKNLKSFIGRPIIAYAIDVAKKCALFDRIIVSTDDNEIAAIANELGAEVPFIRPASISDDHATTLDVIKHAIEWLQADKCQTIEAVCCLYATVPFTRAMDLVEGLALLESHDTQYTFAATRFSFPIQRSIRLNSDENVEMFWPEHFSTRSQDLEPAYHDAGMFYWGRPDTFLAGLPIFAPHSKVVQIPHYRVQDIDEPDDWIRAEMLYQILSQRGEL
ncbi:pseudaminic acid cytidylyltransferase [Enterovibrio nigricans]|uniref:N-acylneuraminate cytidylyltransferase n=1 Tax=Enterovibrio nigricans DSM 22720 TaxID=1121868 RepID=A0A1T4UBL1_9GAMM|nr:pseudaminic acid cytidylyltransferase [Enterovibrio nigricans]PKF51594.1 pseudaminic acid cytidylyltransferase [Enterovibrio nigricans]SKA49851.1 N-acylneuraminate cytidylyltransferase [Enterovibrio nigricans DSM 22720]